MEFNAQTFETNIISSELTRFKYELHGAFYVVYTDDFLHFYMGSKYEESILDRIYYYKTYFMNSKFPIFTFENKFVSDTYTNEDILFQVLGLPKEVIYKKINNGSDSYMLPPDEIVNRIIFIDELNDDSYTELDTESESIYDANKEIYVEIVNYLLTQGFFFQNLDIIENTLTYDDTYYYPVKVNIDKINPKYLKEKETSAKLYMDFADVAFIIQDKQQYLDVFKMADKMSFTDMVEFAYNKPYDNSNPVMLEFISALRRYICAIVSDIVNEYIEKKYHFISVFNRTVLNHDYRVYGCVCRYVYLGTNFEMSFNESHIVKEGENRFLYKKHTYKFYQSYKAKLKFVFEVVQKYFRRHLELGFVPELFLKMMGVPYPCYETVKYFDFENGTSSQFVALFDYIYNSFSLRDSLFSHPMVDKNGLLNGDHRCFILAYDKNYYLSDCSIFYKELATDHLFATKDKKSGIYLGDYACFKKSFASIISESSSTGVKRLHPIENFLEAQNTNGIIVPLKEYVDCLNEGYSLREAFFNKLSKFGLDYEIFTCFFLLTFEQEYETKVSLYEANSEQQSHVLTCLAHEKISCQGYSYCLTELGIVQIRNRFGYNLSLDFAVSKKDIEIYQKFISKFDKLSWAFSYDGIFYPTVLNSSDLTFASMANISYSTSHILQTDFLDDEENQYMIEHDETLKIIKLNRDLAYEGFLPIIFYNDFAYLNYKPNERTDEKLSWILNKDVVHALYEKLLIEDGDSKNQLPTEIYFNSVLYKESLKNNYEPVEDKKEEEFFERIYAEIAKAYISKFNPSEDTFFFSYKHDFKNGISEYILPGKNFNAYSFEDKLDTYYFEKEDEDAIVFALNSALNINKACFGRFPATLRRLSILDAGVPIPLLVKFISIFRNEKNINRESLEKYFEFKDVHHNLKELKTIHLLCHKYEAKFSMLKNSIQISNSLIKQGFYIKDDSNCINNFLNDYITKEDVFHIDHYEYNGIKIHIDENPTGDVLTLLKPDIVFFSNFVRDAIDKFNTKELSDKLVFYTMESLIECYNQDHNFLINFINKYYSYNSLDRKHKELWNIKSRKPSFLSAKEKVSCDLLILSIILKLIDKLYKLTIKKYLTNK